MNVAFYGSFSLNDQFDLYETFPLGPPSSIHKIYPDPVYRAPQDEDFMFRGEFEKCPPIVRRKRVRNKSWTPKQIMIEEEKKYFAKARFKWGEVLIKKPGY